MIPYENFNNSSTTIHILNGFAFLCLGVFETIKIQNPDNVFRKYIPFIFFIVGFLSFLSIFYYMNFDLNQLKISFNLRPALYILNAISFSFMAYGISLFLFFLNPVNLWKYISFLLFLFILFLYIFFSYKVNVQAQRDVLIIHLGIVLPLFLSFIFEIINKKFNKLIISKIIPILIFISAFQLIIYKEIEDSFKYKMITFETQNSENIKEKNEIKNTSQKSSSNRPVAKSKK